MWKPSLIVLDPILDIWCKRKHYVWIMLYGSNLQQNLWFTVDVLNSQYIDKTISVSSLKYIKTSGLKPLHWTVSFSWFP